MKNRQTRKSKEKSGETDRSQELETWRGSSTLLTLGLGAISRKVRSHRSAIPGDQPIAEEAVCLCVWLQGPCCLPRPLPPPR